MSYWMGRLSEVSLPSLSGRPPTPDINPRIAVPEGLATSGLPTFGPECRFSFKSPTAPAIPVPSALAGMESEKTAEADGSLAQIPPIDRTGVAIGARYC